MKTFACSVNYGSGGFGRHFAELIEAAWARGELARYYTPSLRPGDEGIGQVVRARLPAWVMQYTPLRFSPGWKSHLSNEVFDRAVAVKLQAPLQTYTGFVGQSLHSFHAARRLGAQRLELVAANSHVDNVLRRHAQARQKYSWERSWLNEAQAAKTRQEYALADAIYVASEYSRQTFLDAGIAEQKLHRHYLTPHSRFAAPTERLCDGIFRIVYVGSLGVTKGIPLLLEAFSRLTGAVQLTLVGGWASREMRRYLQDAMARDPRIQLAPGDPLPHLHRANICVHPTYEDGFAYAVAEALACGVPTIVTEDTGAKELIREGENGYIVPTGSAEVLWERLNYVKTRWMPILQQVGR